MSEPDSTPRRRPPTIDLTAQEVEPEQQSGSAQNSAAARAANNSGSGNDAAGARRGGISFGRAAPYAIGITAGAVAVAAIVAGTWMAGLMPARDSGAQTSTAAPLVATASAVTPGARTAPSPDEISSRLDKIQEALQAPRPAAALSDRLAAEEARMKSLSDSLVALTQRVDAAAAASQAALAQGKSTAAAAEETRIAASGNVRRGDMDALASRIAALESAIKSLSADVAQRTTSADDRATRATVAAEALRSAVERGVPFQAELGAVKSLGIDHGATAPLEAFAAGGIPSTAALGRELTALTPALARASEPAASNGSFVARLESHLQKLVRITPVDTSAAATSDDASSAIARINAAAARGDVTAALAEIARLPDAARALADGWVQKAAAREAAIAASRRIAADALATLGRPASQ